MVSEQTSQVFPLRRHLNDTAYQPRLKNALQPYAKPSTAIAACPHIGLTPGAEMRLSRNSRSAQGDVRKD